jgi:hypothetical protein
MLTEAQEVSANVRRTKAAIFDMGLQANSKKPIPKWKLAAIAPDPRNVREISQKTSVILSLSKDQPPENPAIGET